jgi:hypothetical protein
MTDPKHAPYIRATDAETEAEDPLFCFDAWAGRVLDAFAAIGIFAVFLVACFFWGYLK